MKTCKRCKKEQPINNFNSSHQISQYTGIPTTYYSTYCKECGKLICKERRQTTTGMFTDIYNGQLLSSKKRKHSPPNYTQEELQIWMEQQDTYQILVENWIKLKFNRWYKPSCDRLDNSKPYTLNNLRLVTAGENCDTYKQGVQDGTEIRVNTKKVDQYDLNNIFIKTYPSINIAARAINASPPNILNCCKGKYKTSKGFIWRYTDD